MSDQPIVDVYFVAAGGYHDIDFARLEMLKLFAEDDRLRVRVADSYHDVDAILASDYLVTYTCDLPPTKDEQVALKEYIASGKRWFALHGTNAIFDFANPNGVGCPETEPVLMETLGTQFIAHPPIMPFKVKLADPDHELVKGIEEFETDDELYLCRVHGNLHHLLETHFNGEATGFAESEWHSDDARPVYYINTVGDGEVLYLNLGHCRGHYDMRPLTDYYPVVERGSWEREEFYELLRRGIRYCTDRVLAERAA